MILYKFCIASIDLWKPGGGGVVDLICNGTVQKYSPNCPNPPKTHPLPYFKTEQDWSRFFL